MRRRIKRAPVRLCGTTTAIVMLAVSCRETPETTEPQPATASPKTASRDRPSAFADQVHGSDKAARMPPLDSPTVKGATSADHMLPNDLVFGIVVDGRTRAYPWWIVKNYHAVNDTIGETPTLIAFCEQCSAATAFHRVVKGCELAMDVAGIYSGSIMLCDRQTRSFWSPFDGVALSGSMEGEKLDRIPLFLTNWDDWKARHPETDVAWDQPWRRRGHGSWYEPGKWGIVDMMGETIQTWDTRLAEHDLVYGILNGGIARAYPLSTLKSAGDVVNDSVAETPIVVVARGDYESAGYQRTLDDRVLTFERADQNPQGAMRDRETGSLWSIEGRAVQGPLEGRQLSSLEGYGCEWHIWSAYHSETEVYGEAVSNVRAGAPFPTFELRRLDTGVRQQLPLSGSVNVIALWASWCPPCREEIPRLQSFAAANRDQDVSVVSIAVHFQNPQELEKLTEYVRNTRLDMPIYLVDDSSYRRLDQLSRRIGGRGVILPMAFVTDRAGTIQALLAGGELKRLDETVEQLLEKQATIDGQ